MATAPIQRPILANTTRPDALTRQSVSNGGNTFAQQNFVRVTSSILVQCPTDGTTVYGFCTDQSHTSTEEPYDAPFGQNHSVVDTDGQQFVVNITDASGNIGSGSTTQADVTIGEAYAIIVKSGGAYDGYQFLDSSDTTNDFFRVDGRFEGDLSTDFNGRVYVTVVATRQ